MKTRTFRMENLIEISKEEQREINGGFFGVDDLIIGLTLGVAMEIISDWDNFKAGLSGRPPVVK